MKITEIRRALACAIEAALCNSCDDTVPTVCLSVDEAERVAAALLRLEVILNALPPSEVAV